MEDKLAKPVLKRCIAATLGELMSARDAADTKEPSPCELPPLSPGDVDLDALVAAAELVRTRAEGPWQAAVGDALFQLALIVTDMADQSDDEPSEDDEPTEPANQQEDEAAMC